MTRTTLIDLSRLPQPTFTESQSFESLLEEMRAALVAAMPEAQRDDVEATLQLESEPLTKLLEQSAYRIMIERQAFNDRAARLMLAYAEGAELDHIGVTYYQTERLTLSGGERESDAAYRRRLLLAFDGYSTAGARDAYIYHALSASGDVLDAAVTSAKAGVVTVTVLSREGNGTAAGDLLDTVDAALSDETVRPLNDQVEVQSADVAEYEIRATLTIREGPAKSVVAQAARDAAEAYAADRHRLGLPIVRDAVLAALWVESVEHVALQSPTADIERGQHQAGYCTLIEVDHVE
ncbi:Baseplate J-like protein [Halomonas sp. THAF12]|uniref:baseplate assembly protein n=1 Tax=Halomonas sp. THAF12 TaxID=2587849 RepID=UPI001268F849|nr:baseplate J/gp47 family protein [Halomonas sp. THAF12]QFT84490.1 Baseplate J-like protein [Halomonas sp. THAF12]